MINHKHINLLVLPELFPDFEGDWKGVFIEDYLNSVETIEPQTLYMRLQANFKGLKDELYRGKFKVRRFALSDKRVSRIMKPFMYIQWFITGKKLAKDFPDINIIHAHGAILNGTLAYLIAKKRNIPFVVTEHTGPYDVILNSWFNRIISKFVLQRAAKVLVVSEHQKQQVLRLGIDASNVEVSYNPINTEIYKPKDTSLSKNILFVSRLDEFKGGLRTVKAFHQFKKEYANFTLTIVGEGEEYELISEYIKNNDLKNSVLLKGSLTKDQIANLMGESSFMVFPSRHETFGLVVAEALCCGLPVVCTNKTAPQEFVNVKNGMLVEPDSIEDIHRGMAQMIAKRSEFDADTIHNEIANRFGLKPFGIYLLNTYNAVL